MRKPGSIMGEFKIYGGFRIGVGNGTAIVFFGGGYDFIRRCEFSDNRTLVVFRHLGNVGILTEFTFEIASHRCNGIGKTARIKMK